MPNSVESIFTDLASCFVSSLAYLLIPDLFCPPDMPLHIYLKNEVNMRSNFMVEVWWHNMPTG